MSSLNFAGRKCELEMKSFIAQHQLNYDEH